MANGSLRICLDPGHAGTANKGVVNGYWESHMVYDLAYKLKEQLEKYENVTVFVTKPVLDCNPSLEERGQMAGKNNCEVFISLHSNAASAAACGVSVFRSVKRPDSVSLGQKLGQAVVDTMRPGTGVTYLRGNGNSTRLYPNTTNTDYYGVIRNSVKYDCVKYSYIIEHGFHTNTAECTWLYNDDNVDKLAVAEAKILASYFGLKAKETEPVDPTPTTKIEEGDIVQFAGGPVYSSSNATSTNSSAVAGPAKVTRIYNGKHPYHLIHTDKTTSVYGWVDANLVTKGGSVTPTPEPDPEPTPDVCPYDEPTSNVAKGAQGEGVKWVQWYLTNDGYPVTIDGIFGTDTYNKVRAFQKDQGISVDGIVGKDTRNCLKNPQNIKTNPYNEPTTTIRSGNTGEGVKWVQWELVESDYDIAIDGIFGSATLAAVKDFQSKAGIGVDGLVGKDTRNKLKSFTGAPTDSNTSTDFKVGDKVIVNGAITAYGNGTGSTMAKHNATMYVHDIVSSSQYKNYIGVSATKTSSRQGWASPSMLKKA